MVDIALVRSNSIVYDIRTIKILRSLCKKYDILILGWDRNGLYDLDRLKKGINCKTSDFKHVRILGLRAPIGRDSLVSYIPMVFYFPIFWSWVLIHLIKSKPKVIYGCDLDTILPCYVYKVLFKKKLIFDVYDRYAMTLIPSKLKTLHAIINLFEEFFSSHVDVLINISKAVLDTFRKKPSRSMIIMNCPQDYDFKKQDSNEHRPLKVVYTGAIWRRTRGLEGIISAVKDLPDVEFVVAGWYREKDKELVNQILKAPNVKFKGLLEPAQALALEASSDVMIALYDPGLQLYSVTLPNKLFEAMMCGVPLITNVASHVVNEVGSGVIVKYDDIEQIKKAIISLRDDTHLRYKLGQNGRNAFLQKYSWSKMEQKLFKICDELLYEQQSQL